MKKSLLLVSFQYPPVQSSSGLLRSLAFSRHLAEMGWDIYVLTANVVSDEMSRQENIQLVPPEIQVIRTRAFDVSQKLSFKGRYPGILEWPDRYSSWVLSASLAGLWEVYKRKIDVIMSTYPIASAHLIGYCLAKLTGKPWVADFRDPMIMAEHPDTALRRKAHTWVERKTVEISSAVTVTNTHARTHYIDKFPNCNAGKFHVIENGYDEHLFNLAELSEPASDSLGDAKNPLKILHSGTLYPNHRDPRSLFEAIEELSSQWTLTNTELKFVFRASGYDEYYQEMVASMGITRWVEFSKSVGYVDSITEMLYSDALLLIQGSSCNQQVPAKLYEYLRAAKPIIPITDHEGATATTLRAAGITQILNCNSKSEIKNGLSEILPRLCLNEASDNTAGTDTLERYSRAHWSKQLDIMLNDSIIDL